MIKITSVADALAKADALKALGKTTIHFFQSDEVPDFPIDKVHAIEKGSSYRLGAPIGVWLVYDKDGLTFKLDFEFETRETNGTNTLAFGDRIQQLMQKLSPIGRESLANHIKEVLLPPMEKRRDEAERYYATQVNLVASLKGILA
jgi:hypothetical protein